MNISFTIIVSVVNNIIFKTKYVLAYTLSNDTSERMTFSNFIYIEHVHL
jgi:hypothetical protein